MMLLADADALTLMMPTLDGEDFPADVTKEYERRIRLKHAVTTGPLGPPALAEMLVNLGYDLPEMKAEPVKTDWRSIPEGTPIQVEQGDKWVLGTFHDVVDDGRLTVTFGGDEFVHEFFSYECRLTGEDVQPPTVSEAKIDRADPEPLTPLPTMERQWSDLEAGASLEVWAGDDIKRAEFVEVGPKDHELTVYIKGELHAVNEKDVLRAD